jgi:hypothetical protein
MKILLIYLTYLRYAYSMRHKSRSTIYIYKWMENLVNFLFFISKNLLLIIIRFIIMKKVLMVLIVVLVFVIAPTFANACEYTVSANAGPNGTISPNSQTVHVGDTTTFTVTPNAGYTASASGCNGSLSGTTYTTGAISADCTVTATFTLIPVKVDGGWTDWNTKDNTCGVSGTQTRTCTNPTPSNGGADCSLLDGGNSSRAYTNDNCSTPTATISATKIICPTENLLPNWGAGGPDITSKTASDFLAANPSCHTATWNFEWAPSTAINPGDSVTVAGGSWTPFTSTTSIPTGNDVWVREQSNSDYIPFTGVTTTKNVSAELYCNTDVLNYDNYDEIYNPKANTTYYCVAFNVLKSTPVTSYTVTASAGTNGTITPPTQSVNSGTTTAFTVTPATGYTATMGGTCPAGTLTGTTYTTGNITSDCTVTATFNQTTTTITVTATAGPNGTITPSSQTTGTGTTVNFTVTPATGYLVSSMDGTCPTGSLSGTTYTTGNITADCTVTATFGVVPPSNIVSVTATAVGNGTITPPVIEGGIGVPYNFVVTPNAGYQATMSGTCPAGTLTGNAYATGIISASCNVIATFTLIPVGPSSSLALTTNSATFITSTSATLNGAVTNIGSTNPTIEGFEYGTTTTYGSNVNTTGSFNVGAYTGNVSLQCGTTYHFRAYATDSVGTQYGTDQSFTTNSCGGTHSSGGYSTSSGGRVLAATTTCGIYVDKYMRMGLKGNDVDAVKKVQLFMNNYMGSSLKIDGIFGPKTDAAVRAFQAKQFDKVLSPWGLTAPTGIFYLTTQTEVNNIMCPPLNLPIPSLVPMNQNASFPKY